ncbi:MAG: hypothetical protein ACREFY_05030 [Acetobacteraceae bacterium]
MRGHHDALVAEFATNPPDWQLLAEVFSAEGLTDRTGKPPSPAATRLTWYRVRQAAQSRRQAQQAEERPLSGPERALSELPFSPPRGNGDSRSVVGTATARPDEADDEPGAPPKFQLARPIGLAPTKAAPNGAIRKGSDEDDE